MAARWPTKSQPVPSLPAQLLRQWQFGALVAGGLLVSGYFGLRAIWSNAAALAWAALTLPALIALLLFLLRNLHLNAPPDSGPLFSDLGPANTITLARGLMAATLAGFVVLPRPPEPLAWFPFVLYSCVIWLDLLDGYVARRTGRVTALGVKLDMEYDCFAGLIASVLVVRYGQLPWWYLAWGLARYIFIAGLGWLEWRGRPIYPLPPSVIRRIAAGLQMAFASVMLMPLFSPPATTVAGVCFLAPLLLGFVRDWLVMSGAVAADGPGYRAVARVYDRVARWLPVALRLAATLIAVLYLAPRMGIVGLLALVGGVALLLGVGNRFAALLVLLAMCLDVLARGYQPQHAALIVALIGILYLGGGALSLWPADDALFVERRGGRRLPLAVPPPGHAT